jgi:hypothetical protein
MRDTQLIMVEGLPGLGKTTTASWLAARLRAEHLPVRLYLESQPEHPINVGGNLHPAGDVTGETYFQQYRPASFIQESLQRWQAFVDDAMQTDAISVLDSYPFQNSIRILLQMDAALDDMRAYAAQVEALVMPLRPALIYLSHREWRTQFSTPAKSGRSEAQPGWTMWRRWSPTARTAKPDIWRATMASWPS